MTETIDFPLDPTGGAALAAPTHVGFTLLDQIEDLPDSPGLYVLMGRDPLGGLRPLGFGHAERLNRLPLGADFALALQDGLHCVGIAPLPAGVNGPELACTLGETMGAPINTRHAALRAIEAARLTASPAPVAAE